MIKLLDLADDNGIEYITSGNHHCRAGWVQFCCPHCGDSGWHLGYNINKEYFTCYSCGGHSLVKTISKLLSVSWSKAQEILAEYSDGRVLKGENFADKILFDVKDIEVKLPLGTRKMQKHHRDYLRSRGYNAKKLERIWGLQGTGVVGTHKNRIVIPMTFNNELVTYTTRSITNSSARYINCKPELERMSLKSILYGWDLCEKSSDSILIFEGCTSCWRFGINSVATMGATYTMEQVMLMKRKKNRYIIFDPSEKESMKKADELGDLLSSFEGHTEVIDLSDECEDPAELSQKSANKIKRILKI